MSYKTPEPPDELLRLFDKDDNEVEPRTRQWIWDHPEYETYFAVGDIWVINSEGQMLCSKRSENLKSAPGKWQTRFGGRVPVGSTSYETAIRELEEEAGIIPEPDKLFLVEETSRVARFIYPFNGNREDLHFNDGEIAAVRWMTVDEYLEEERAHPELWPPGGGMKPHQVAIIREWINKQKRLPKDIDWSEHHVATKSYPPSPLLIRALDYVKQKAKVIDIGAGALKDTRYLLEQGFEVTAVDKEDLTLEMVKEIESKKFHMAQSLFADLNFPVNEYDLASAQYALPFNPPQTFEMVFEKIKASLVKEGIFCGQCFGIHDEWSDNLEMTFHTKEQVEKMLSDMEIIFLQEEQRDNKLSDGTPKHWHVINFIARKK